MEPRSDFLYARPSLWEGMSRIIDFGNTLNEYNNSPMADEIAIRMDWVMVGNSLYNAIKTFEEQEYNRIP